MEREDLTVLAYRFAGDSFCRAERFAAYQEALGDRFVRPCPPRLTLANPNAPMKNPHSVVTAHLIDREGEPTRQALEEILGFLPHAAAGRKKGSVRAVGVAFGTGLTTISRASRRQEHAPGKLQHASARGTARRHHRMPHPI